MGFGVDPIAAEQALLATLMLDPDQIHDVDWLQPDDFSWPVHAEMWTLIRQQYADLDEGVSPFNVAQGLAAAADRNAGVRAARRADARPAALHGDDLLDRTDRIRLERERAELITRAYLAVADVLDAAAPLDATVAGRVVLDASVQRQLAAVGEQVTRIGVDGLGEPGELVDRAVARIDLLRDDLDRIRSRAAASDEAVDRLPDEAYWRRYEPSGDPAGVDL